MQEVLDSGRATALLKGQQGQAQRSTTQSTLAPLPAISSRLERDKSLFGFTHSDNCKLRSKSSNHNTQSITVAVARCAYADILEAAKEMAPKTHLLLIMTVRWYLPCGTSQSPLDASLTTPFSGLQNIGCSTSFPSRKTWLLTIAGGLAEMCYDIYHMISSTTCNDSYDLP